MTASWSRQIGVAIEPRASFVSFDEVYQSRFDDVFRMVAHLLGPGAGAEDIEDVTQLVFEAAYKAWPRFRGESRVSTWLYGVAYNVVMRQLRSWSRHRRLLAAVEAEPKSSIDHGTPEIQLGRRQEVLRVWRCLLRIKPERRLVYVMHEIEGRTAREIADILNVSMHTVGGRLRQARQELAEHLAKLDAQEELR